MANKFKLLLTILTACLLAAAAALLAVGIWLAVAAAPTGVLPSSVIALGGVALAAALAGGAALTLLWLRLRE